MSPPSPPGQSDAQILGAFIAGLRPEDVPEPVLRAAAWHALDALGCGLAAVGVDAAPAARALARTAAGTGPCSALGVAEGVDPGTAAFANGALCHALDFDDTHGPSICHITTLVLPAALAVAEQRAASVPRLLTALVAGSEVVTRIGAAAAPAYMRTGFHHTSVCGVFGAAAATASLLDLDAAATTHALALCTSMASGSLEFLGDGSTSKVVNAGAAARAGVLAAQLAAFGADGPASVLEGRFGLFASHFRLPPPATGWLDDLGERWETPTIAYKAYPACHFIHSSLDGARAAAEHLGVLGDPDRIAAVEVEVPEPALPLVLEPREAKIAPRTPYEGKFSLQYSVAAMLIDGAVGVASYAPAAIADPSRLRLAARVAHRASELDTYPAAFPARVTVRAGGAAHTVAVPFQRGSDARPLHHDDVLGKFIDNATLALPDADHERLASCLRQPSEQDDARALGTLLRRAGAR